MSQSVPPPPFPPPPPVPPPPPPAPPSVPRTPNGHGMTMQRIGDYDLLGQVGGGGMGTVYRSFDWRRGAKVAIKILSAEAAQSSPDVEALFRASIDVQVRLRHPNILRVLETGTVSGLPYAVFEYCPSSFRFWGKPRELIRAFKDVCAAVQYAHEQGVIHGDIKPSNLLIAADGRVVITDFVDRDVLSRLATSRQAEGQAWGTARYMSPQRLLDGIPSIGDDIYALGALLLSQIGDLLDYSSDMPVEELAKDKRHGRFRAPGRYRFTIVDRVVRRAMAGDERKRYRSVSQICAELERPPFPYFRPLPLDQDTGGSSVFLVDEGGTAFPIDAPKTRIGRRADNDIVVVAPTVSVFHAEIMHQGGYFVRDLGSTNGTFVNDGRVSTLMRLRGGDQIRVGAKIFTVVTPPQDPDTKVFRTIMLPVLHLVNVETQQVFEIRESSGRIGFNEVGEVVVHEEGDYVVPGSPWAIERPLVEFDAEVGEIRIRALSRGTDLLLNGKSFSEAHLADGDHLDLDGRRYQVRSALPEWAKEAEEHLLETGCVAAKDLRLVPPSGRVRAVEECWRRYEGWDLVYDPATEELRFRRRELYLQFRRLWWDARLFLFEELGLDLVAELISFIARVLGLRTRQAERFAIGRFLVTALDVSPIVKSPRIGPMLPLAVFASRDLTQEDISPLQRVAASFERHFAPVMLVPLLSPQAIDPNILQTIESVYAIDLFPATYDDLVRLLFARDSADALRGAILSHANLQNVAPFVVTGPTDAQMFVGREDELQRIRTQVTHASFIVVGGRRIGKTSLLLHLHRVRLPAAGLYTVYHDCSVTPTLDGFLSSKVSDWQPGPPPGDLASIGDLLRALPLDRPVVLLLDEADKLVPGDRAGGWPLLKALRALVNSGRVQVILCGERSLREAMGDASGPLFNFANEILLGPLNLPAVEELITRPMKQLGIEFADEKAIVDRIWAFTSGHPNVVQRLCRRLIERLHEQGTRRISPGDVDAVIENPRFQRDDFLSAYWEAATPLERIISLLMAEDERVRTLQAIRSALATRSGLQPSAREVDAALQRLVDLRSILKHTSDGYDFAVGAFPRVVAGTMTLDDMLEVLREEYQEHGR